MSNFDSEDPTADFLARERAILGEDFMGGDDAQSTITETASAIPHQQDFDNFDNQSEWSMPGSVVPPSHVDFNNDDEMSNFPPVEALNTALPTTPPAHQQSASPFPQTPSSFNEYDNRVKSPPQHDYNFTVQDTKFLRESEQRQKAEVDSRDEKLKELKAKTIDSAKDYLQKFNDDYQKTLDKQKSERNSKSSQNNTQTFDNLQGSGWEKVNNIIEAIPINTSGNQSFKDTSRMKNLIKDLKSNPVKAKSDAAALI